MTYKLYHNDTLIGLISNITPEDNFESSGNIELTNEFERYRPVFDYLLANDGQTDGPQPFGDDYFDNWFLEDEEGKRTLIGIPAIENGEAIWRDP